MNLVLWRHHPGHGPMTIKWTAMTFGLAMMWTGMVGLLMVKQPQLDVWWLLTGVWLIAAAYQAFGPFHARANEFGLRIPVTSRRLLGVHLAAMVVLSGGMLLLCLVPQSLFLHFVTAPSDRAPELFLRIGALLPRLWSHGLAWWLLLLAFSFSDRPQLAVVERDRRWYLRQAIGFAVATAGMVAAGPHLGHPFAALIAVVALGWIVATWRRRPAVLSLAPTQPRVARLRHESAVVASRLPWWRRPPLWTAILMGTAKNPLMWIISAPIVFAIGLWMGNAFPALLSAPNMSLAFLPITAYMVFTIAATPLFKIARFAHLPVSTDRMLAILLVPQILLLGAGYAVGEVWAARQGRAADEPLIFSSEPDRYGLRMDPRFFMLAVGEPPAQTAPDGTIILPPGDWRPEILPGVVIYKPFHTPLGASLDVCAWQLERASEHVFGEAIPAAEFRERYLTVDEAGIVVVREGVELSLMADHPHLTVRWFPALPALQALVVGLLCQASLVIFLAFFRPGRNDRQRKRAFAGVLIALMALHLGQFALDVFDRVDLDGLTAAAFAACDLVGQDWPGGAWSAWVIVAVILGAGHLLVRQQFRRAEWPPVREGDSFMDCLG